MRMRGLLRFLVATNVPFGYLYALGSFVIYRVLFVDCDFSIIIATEKN